MPLLNVFDSDVFGVMSLTAAINHLPYAPGRLGQMGLFTNKPVSTLTVFVESREGKLSLLPTSARGSRTNVGSGPTRRGRDFRVPHLEDNRLVLADDVQGVRAFGSETEVEAVATKINERLQEMRSNHEVTWEWHRIGAVSGVLLDADGSSVIYNYFDEFGLSQDVVLFDLTVDEASVKAQSLRVLRLMQRALGQTPFRQVHAICGDEFFDALVASPSAKAAFDRWQDGQFFREQQGGPLAAGFAYAGIFWENYNGYFNESRNFIATDECQFFPIGVPDLFQTALAPADWIETVNTNGLPFYAKQELMPMGKGVDLTTQSNPLHLCTRPKCLIKGTMNAGSVSSSS